MVDATPLMRPKLAYPNMPAWL